MKCVHVTVVATEKYSHWDSVGALRSKEEEEIYLCSFLTTALEGGEGQCHALASLYPQEKNRTHCTGGWVGIRAVLDMCGKFSPH